MEKTLDLTVVIVTWNSAADIAAAVSSARSQGAEVIVIDNASSDTSVEIAREAGATQVVANASNVGFARACNQGLAKASCKIVLFLNPDARLERGSAQSLTSFFEVYPGADVVGPAIIDASGRPLRSAGATWNLATELANKTLLHRLNAPPSGTKRVAWVTGAALAGRKSSLDRLGGFDPGYFLYYEDLDLCARARKAGLQVWYTDSVRVTHLAKRSSRQVEERALIISEASARRYWQTHGTKFHYLIVRMLTYPEMLLRSLIWLVLSTKPQFRDQARNRLRAYRRIAADRIFSEIDKVGPMADAAPPESPSVSIIVTTYNREELAVRAVESALAQSYKPIEIIVVDDGSVDGTAETMAQFSTRIRYIRQENRERGAARNTGLAASSGELVLFLDSDDEISPGHIANLVKAILSRPGLGLAYTRAEFYDDDTDRVFDVLPRRPVEGWSFLKSAAGNLMTVDSVLVRRSVLDQVGWFDEDRELSGMEDWELWTRCLGASEVAFVPQPSVRVHFHSRNTLGNLQTMERAIRTASIKILDHPLNRDMLRPHRRRLRAAMWALLAHHQMLSGNGRLALARLWEGFREDPSVILQPVWSTMLLKAIAGPQVIGRARRMRRRAHLSHRRRQGTP